MLIHDNRFDCFIVIRGEKIWGRPRIVQSFGGKKESLFQLTFSDFGSQIQTPP